MNRAEGKLFNAFKMHGYNAKKRGISFLFTYEQWLKVWIQSGHLKDRGNKHGQYVMARYGDVGPYSISNVKIIPSRENLIEGRIGKVMSFEARRKLSEYRKGKRPPNFGKPHSDQTKNKIRIKMLAHRAAERERIQNEQT